MLADESELPTKLNESRTNTVKAIGVLHGAGLVAPVPERPTRGNGSRCRETAKSRDWIALTKHAYSQASVLKYCSVGRLDARCNYKLLREGLSL